MPGLVMVPTLLIILGFSFLHIFQVSVISTQSLGHGNCTHYRDLSFEWTYFIFQEPESLNREVKYDPNNEQGNFSSNSVNVIAIKNKTLRRLSNFFEFQRWSGSLTFREIQSYTNQQTQKYKNVILYQHKNYGKNIIIMRRRFYVLITT